MPHPGVFNRLRSYFWQEQQPNAKLEITIDEPRSEVSVAEQAQAAPAAPSKTEGPNDELRSFFEANGDRELSKVEVLGVLNLISQAVVRDESVLDLSNVSRSANSSAFPPNISHSFSVSNLADLTGGTSNRSMSHSRSRRSLASGPKRQGAKSLTRSQSTHHGISLAKISAPVETRSRRPVRGPVRAPLNRAEISQTASDVLDSLDDPMDVQPQTSRFGSIHPSSTSTLPARSALSVGPLSSSTPAKARPSRFSAQAQPAAQPSAQTPEPADSSFGSKSRPNAFSSFKSSEPETPKAQPPQAQPLQAQLPKAQPPQAQPKPKFAFTQPKESDFEPMVPSFKSAVPDRDAAMIQTPKPFQPVAPAPAPAAAPADVDMDMDMDFDFPQTGSSATVNPAQYEQHIEEFAF